MKGEPLLVYLSKRKESPTLLAQDKQMSKGVNFKASLRFTIKINNFQT